MRAADYIFKTLADFGTEHVFMVSGGGAMFLNDALGREKRIKYICNLHEQACAIAAEGYARISGKPGVINVTTGPGGTNAITGVMGAWVDSIPMIIISGQIKTSTMISTYKELALRSLGDQEINIVDIVKPITKYAVEVKKAEDIKSALDRAWYLCQNGRPGPVWLDIPLDIQSAEIDENSLVSDFVPDVENDFSDDQMNEVVSRLKNAERPVIIAGNGITLSGSRKEFLEFAKRANIPVLTAISGIDLIPSDSKLFFGRPGILGERAANFIMQNSDLMLILGTRMSIRVIGYAFGTVGREAYKIMVDIDEAELNKPTFAVDCKIHCDLKKFFAKMENVSIPANGKWFEYCKKIRDKYPVITASHRDRKDYVSSYLLPEIVGKSCRGDEIIVTGNGTAYTSTFQTFPVKSGMRMFANVACAAMGYDLPAAIGAAIAGKGRQVICFTGDGSIQMNLQELQTLLNYKLPVKLFVYNNGGFLSIKLTQKSFFNGNMVGSDASSGIILPELKKIAEAYGFAYEKLSTNADACAKVPGIINAKEAVFCEVMCDPFEVLSPKAASKRLSDGTMVSAPLEDMFPFLDRDEFAENMLIPMLDKKF